MARLIYSINVSLDGYVADRDGNLEWTIRRRSSSREKEKKTDFTAGWAKTIYFLDPIIWAIEEIMISEK